MPALHLLAGDRIECAAIPARGAIRLDERGTPTTADRDAVVSLVAFGREGCGRPVVAIVPRPGVRVRVGSRTVRFARELRDREHVFFAEREAIFVADAAPQALLGGGACACPVCCSDGVLAVLACPRCGLPACAECWQRFPARRCPGEGCGFTTSLDAPAPRRAEFLTAVLDDAQEDA